MRYYPYMTDKGLLLLCRLLRKHKRQKSKRFKAHPPLRGRRGER